MCRDSGRGYDRVDTADVALDPCQVRPVSHHAAELLAQLNPHPSWRERLSDRDAPKVRALTALVDHARPALIPQIAPFAFARSAEVRHAATQVLDRALETSTPAELVELDKACRQRGGYYTSRWGSAWDALTPLRLSLLDKVGRLTPASLGIASFHGNGYVREAAITRLAASSDGRELPFLLVRMNDWVPSLAKRARVAGESRIVPAFAVAWLTWAPLLLRLGPSTRRSAGDLSDRVLALLLAAEQRPVLLASLASENRLTRRFALQLLQGVQSAPQERVELVMGAARNRDSVLRLQAVAYAQKHLSTEELERVVPIMLADRYSPVRRAALNAAAERLADPARDWLMRALWDPGSAVRQVARYHLERRGDLTDFASHYRRELGVATTVSAISVAAAGLGDAGTRDDADLIVPLLTHNSPRVRQSAARALAMLDLEGQAHRLLLLLDDPSPRVSRVAREALHRMTGALDAEPIRQLVEHGAHLHGRLGALAVAAKLSKWESIPLLLEAATTADTRIRGEARDCIAAWLARQNESFARPSPAQVAALRAQIRAHGGALEPRMRAGLASALEYWATH